MSSVPLRLARARVALARGHLDTATEDLTALRAILHGTGDLQYGAQATALRAGLAAARGEHAEARAALRDDLARSADHDDMALHLELAARAISVEADALDQARLHGRRTDPVAARAAAAQIMSGADATTARVVAAGGRLSPPSRSSKRSPGRTCPGSPARPTRVCGHGSRKTSWPTPTWSRTPGTRKPPRCSPAAAAGTAPPPRCVLPTPPPGTCGPTRYAPKSRRSPARHASTSPSRRHAQARTGSHRRRPDPTRTRSTRPARQRPVQRPDRQDPLHQRKDRQRPCLQHLAQARRHQPRPGCHRRHQAQAMNRARPCAWRLRALPVHQSAGSRAAGGACQARARRCTRAGV